MDLQLPYIKTFKTRPQICFKNIIICNSDLDLNLTIELSQLNETLAELYSPASMLETFTWINFFQSQNVELNLQEFSAAFGFFWNEAAAQLYAAHLAWPDSFKNWVLQKKAHINDLRPLILVSRLPEREKNQVLQLLNVIGSLNPSLSQGKQLLEAFIDVASTEQNFEPLESLILDLRTQNKNLESSLKKLLKLKNPVTSKLDGQKQNFVNKSNWPTAVKVKFQRQGDKAGFEVSTFVTTAAQCESLLAKIEESFKSIALHLKENNDYGI